MLDKTTITDEQVGVSVYVASGDYYFLRLLMHKPLLKRIGNPRRLTIRGQPANGFILEPDSAKGLKLRSVSVNSGSFYLSTTLTKFELSRQTRKTVFVRPQFESGNIMRLPAMPPAWIDAEPEFVANGTEVILPKNPRDDAVLVQNGNGAAPTTPLPKAQAPIYQVPAGADIAAMQAQLAGKLDEARAIIRAIEARTGLRFALNRNLQLVVALTS
jgi:hypothetical protein